MKKKTFPRLKFKVVIILLILMLVGLVSPVDIISQTDTPELLDKKEAILPDSIKQKLNKISSDQDRLNYLLNCIEQSFSRDDTLVALLVNIAEEYLAEDKFLIEQSKLVFWRYKIKMEDSPVSEELSLYAKELESALFIFDQRNSIFWKGRTSALLSHIYYFLYDINEAKRYNDGALTLLNGLPLDTEKEYALFGDIYRVRGNIFYLEDQLDSIKYYYRLARNAYQVSPIKNRKKIIRLFINEGIMSANFYDFESADSAYAKAEKLSIENDSLLLSEIYLEWGITLGDRALRTKKYKELLLSDEKLKQSYAVGRASEAIWQYQIGANFQNKARHLYIDNNDRFYSELDSAAAHYRLATIAAVAEQQKGIIDQVNERTAEICDFIPVPNCTAILSTIGGTYQNIYQLKEEESRQKVEAQKKLDELRQQAIEERNWRNTIILILGSIIAIAITAGIFSFLMQQQKIQNLKKTLEMRMEALKAQMNPHFISNALNAIDSLVNQKRNSEASQYIVYFSRLCRMILDGSKRQFISLKEEVKILKYFLSIEQLRLTKSRLSIIWNIDESLDLESCFVPPLILQPFVENAIWHGILNKEDRAQGTLSITITKKNNMIECQIEDDGVGRERARAMRKESELEWQSHGTAITNERIEALKNIENSNVETIDLYENGVALGTRVIISLPILSKPIEYAN